MGLFSKKAKVNIENFPPIGGLMVSKMIVEEHKKPMFLYRDKRSRPEDSGWRIFSGFESDEYANDPNNAGIYNPSTILAIDSSIAELLLKGGFGSAFERESDKSPWYKVTDFQVEDDYMVRHRLTEDWELEINNLFERRKEGNGDLFYTTGDKSLRMAIWNDNKAKLDIFKKHQEYIVNRDESQTKTLKTFDFSDDEVARIGYKIKESDENREYNVIYGFSIVDKQYIQIALYFDNDEDETWAIETWKGIKLAKK
ncbi:MAG: DUF2185 domain-containing protein [Tannerella sp.]|jgi:hypothetical protein|nr:DUF2185 domain-containing protein [Tannerella sp.]